MENVLRLVRAINFQNLLEIAVNSSPVWGLIIFLLKFYFRKLAKSNERAELRLVRIEEKIDLLTGTLLTTNPTDLKKDIEVVMEIQKSQQMEIQAQWQAILDLRRLRTRELTPI